jgi:hypothetical protein
VVCDVFLVVTREELEFCEEAFVGTTTLLVALDDFSELARCDVVVVGSRAVSVMPSP